MQRRQFLQSIIAATAAMGAGGGLSAQEPPMTTGKLVLLGGNISGKRNPESDEESQIRECDPYGILTEIGKEAGGFERKNVVIITCADEENPEVFAQEIAGDFKVVSKNKIHEPTTITNADDARDPKKIEALKNADIVFFCGGDQKKLVSEFMQSPSLPALKEAFFTQPNKVVAGTSAGAMVMGNQAIYKDLVNLEVFGMVNGYVDTHIYNKGNKFSLDGALNNPRKMLRVQTAMKYNPAASIGIGVPDSTGVVIQGNRVRCFGAKTSEGYSEDDHKPRIIYCDDKQCQRLVVLEHGQEYELPINAAQLWSGISPKSAQIIRE